MENIQKLHGDNASYINSRRPPSFTRLGWKGLFTFLHTAAHSWQALLGEKGLPGTPATYLRGPSAL